MARFDVYRNTNRTSSEEFPFLVDVQADLFEDLQTRVVVPLMSRKAIKEPMTRLNPGFTVEGRNVVLATTDMAGVPLSALGAKVASLAGHSAEILGAVDFLLTGA